jgi:micrococcal nuclease
LSPDRTRRARLLLAALLAATIGACSPVSGPAVTSPATDGGRPPASLAPLAPAGVAPSGPTEVARVVRITDGDTIRVLLDGQDRPLRYIGIDTPESVAPNTPVEPFALAATAANARLVQGREVVLEKDVSETDRFDRLLRYVWLAPPEGTDGAWVFVNLELVRAGVAEARAYPPDTRYDDLLEAAESDARAARRGMWVSE